MRGYVADATCRFPGESGRTKASDILVRGIRQIEDLDPKSHGISRKTCHQTQDGRRYGTTSPVPDDRAGRHRVQAYLEL